jgi:hypothetical protein
VAGVRLELLSNVLLGAAATPAVWITALVQLLFEMIATILPEVTHSNPPGCA